MIGILVLLSAQITSITHQLDEKLGWITQKRKCCRSVHVYRKSMYKPCDGAYTM